MCVCWINFTPRVSLTNSLVNIFVARIDFNCEFKCLSSVILKLQFFCTASVRKHEHNLSCEADQRISFSETRDDVLSCKFCSPPIWNWISEFKGKLTNGSIVCQFTENSTTAIQLCVRELVSHSPAATKIGLAQNSGISRCNFLLCIGCMST